MIQILPTDALRLRAIIFGCWPVPRIFGVPVRRSRPLVVPLDVQPRLVHHHDKETPDDAEK